MKVNMVLLCFIVVFTLLGVSQACTITEDGVSRPCGTSGLSCSGNPSICIVNCTEDYASSLCKTTLDAVTARYLEVHCSGVGSCVGLSVLYPQAGDFRIICTGNQSCNNLYLPPASRNDGTVHTGAQFALDCLGNRSCSNAIINCPVKYYNSINCSSKEACYSAKFNASSTLIFRLSCEGISSCASTELVWSGNLGYSLAIINCLNNASCYNATINATGSSYLNINCSGASSCRTAKIVGAGVLSTLPGVSYGKSYSHINCVGDFSCNSTQINSIANDLTLNCNGISSCRASKILCPQNGRPCSIQCIGDSSCYSNNFDISKTKNWSIACEGQASCQAAQVRSSGYSNTGILRCLNNSGSGVLACSYQNDQSKSFNCTQNWGVASSGLLNCSGFSGPSVLYCSQLSSLSYNCSEYGGSGKVECSGSSSCYGSNITAINNSVCVKCSGVQSCQKSSLLSNDVASVSCLATDSCRDSQLAVTKGTHENIFISCAGSACKGSGLTCAGNAGGDIDYYSIGCIGSGCAHVPSVTKCSRVYTHPTKDSPC